MAGIHNRNRIAGLALCVVVFAGCGVAKVPDAVENTSLIIDKDGGIVSHVVEALDQDYYKLDELKKMAQEEMAAYNTLHQKGEVTPVTLKRVEKLAGDDNSAVVTYSYDSAATYEAYTGNELFYGTVGEAGQAGYRFETQNRKLTDGKGKKSIEVKDLCESAMAGKHVVLVGEMTRVYCPYRVSYISSDAKVLQDGSIDTTGVSPQDYPVIIVLDK